MNLTVSSLTDSIASVSIIASTRPLLDVSNAKKLNVFATIAAVFRHVAFITTVEVLEVAYDKFSSASNRSHTMHILPDGLCAAGVRLARSCATVVSNALIANVWMICAWVVLLLTHFCTCCVDNQRT